MLKHLLKAISLVSLLTLPAFSLGGGAGFHWGFDFSTSMTDEPKEALNFYPNLENPFFDLLDGFDSNIKDELSSTPILYVSRENFERGAINFGGKAFVNLRTLPIDLEASINFGTWRYDGAIHYIDPSATNDSLNAQSDATASLSWLQKNGPVYGSQKINMQAFAGDKFFGLGLDKTPYAKLHADLTIKKTFKPKIIGRFIQPSLGLGASIHFETPVLSEKLLTNALDMDFSDLDPSMLTGDSDAAKENLKKIMDEITESGKKPKMGMHILVGTSIKPPLIPLGFYVDGKYNITFKNEEDDSFTKTNGFLLNTGIMFKIGS